ncbi:hypothetical protein NL676_036063 [Syzygium grande]|nr:hypothetical protein NL676_036063 [Syzygium grande]
MMISEGNKSRWLGLTINNLQKQKLCRFVLVRTRHSSQWTLLLDMLLEGHVRGVAAWCSLELGWTVASRCRWVSRCKKPCNVDSNSGVR